MMLHTHYENGIEHGECEQWFPNSELKIRVRYKNGKMDRPFEEYYESGQLKRKASFVDGSENGDFESFWENGNIMCRGSRGGNNEDNYTYWDNTGKIVNTVSNIKRLLTPIKKADEEKI
jgi:antitoxin component YwqK of YwqJK toxin-antitoxin module